MGESGLLQSRGTERSRASVCSLNEDELSFSNSQGDSNGVHVFHRYILFIMLYESWQTKGKIFTNLFIISARVWNSFNSHTWHREIKKDPRRAFHWRCENKWLYPPPRRITKYGGRPSSIHIALARGNHATKYRDSCVIRTLIHLRGLYNPSISSNCIRYDCWERRRNSEVPWQLQRINKRTKKQTKISCSDIGHL